MTPADYRERLQQLHRRLQTASLAGSPRLGVFTHDYGLIWLEIPAGDNVQLDLVRNWQRHLPDERWLLTLAPFYLPLTGTEWAGIPNLEQVDSRIRQLPEVLLPGAQGDVELLCRDPQATVEKLIAAEAWARQTILTRMTAISGTQPRPQVSATKSCWNCDQSKPHSCLGNDCVNFRDYIQTGATG
ncbi:hypothetical protein H8D51_04470 [bacterium]|nr:hypothetical protein [bacterium]